MSRGITQSADISDVNTKTTVKQIKTLLGILGNAEEEDRWKRFLRASGKTYDRYKARLDPSQTWTEVEFHLRQEVIQAVFMEFPQVWQERQGEVMVKEVCNRRLFALHHARRLKYKDTAQSAQTEISGGDPEAPGTAEATSSRPFDPVRDV